MKPNTNPKREYKQKSVMQLTTNLNMSVRIKLSTILVVGMGLLPLFVLGGRLGEDRRGEERRGEGRRGEGRGGEGRGS